MAFAPFALLYQIFRHLQSVDRYFFSLAICVDQAGNVIASGLFNDILIKSNGYKFGSVDETISSCVGKNKQRGTLRICGKILYWILNSAEPNHSENAIEKDENDSNVP